MFPLSKIEDIAWIAVLRFFSLSCLRFNKVPIDNVCISASINATFNFSPFSFFPYFAIAQAVFTDKNDFPVPGFMDVKT